MKLIFHFGKHHQNVKIEIVYTSGPDVKIEIVYTSDPKNFKIEIVYTSDPNPKLIGATIQNFIKARTGRLSPKIDFFAPGAQTNQFCGLDRPGKSNI